jgi:hypothetical protein
MRGNPLEELIIKPQVELDSRKDPAMKSTLMYLSPAVLLAALLSQALAGAAEDSADGWMPLFNGKDLDGWVQRGGKAKYRVEDGQIVGSSVPNTTNSFLCTRRDYADFILELEFKVDPRTQFGRADPQPLLR